jgi:protein-L-isoaspartate(D-aspartate) O-methyltransferase
MSDSLSRRTTMVDTQVRPSDVTKFPIIEAMLAVAREDFVPDARRAAAYADAPVDLGGGRVVLEPRTLAKMLDALDIQPSELVLDLGCGLGYSAAVIARLADFVVAVEEDQGLAAEAESRLGDAGADNVAVINGPLAAGDPKHGPYDVIVVEGAVEAMPAAITDQLKDGGRIVAIFAEGMLGTVRLGVKAGRHVDWRSRFNASAPVLPGFAKARSFAL